MKKKPGRQPKPLLLYNPEIKERFISETYPDATQENTRITMAKRLAKFYYYENDVLHKDLYDFTSDEILDLFAWYGAKSQNSTSSILTTITQYHRWAMANGYTNNNIDITKMISKTSLIGTIDKGAIEEQYIKDRDELYRLTKFCINAQDAAPICLLYEGVAGKTHEELVNLKKKDCDFENNKLILTKNDGSQREIIVDRRTMEIVKEAIQQKIYYKSNNMAEVRARTLNLKDSEYVIRPGNFDLVLSKEGQITPQIINQRLKKISQLYNARKLRFLRPKTILMSGLFEYIGKIEEKKNDQLSCSDFMKANKEYGLSEKIWSTTQQAYYLFKQVNEE
jgi:integrase